MLDIKPNVRNAIIKHVKNTEKKPLKPQNKRKGKVIGGGGTVKRSPESQLRQYLNKKYGEPMKKNKTNKWDIDLEYGEIFEKELASILGNKR